MASAKKNGIPLHIVEYHNEALAHIYRAIGSKRLPFDNLTLFHFDSHPDLGIPCDFKASNIYDKEILMESLQIENWILPAVYAGHVNKVVWFKPVWATQLPEGKHEFAVGKDPQSGEIRVSCVMPYFLSDCLFLEDELLVEKKELIFHVITINPCHGNASISLSDFVSDGQPFILDIDLDFFSTCNPFRQMFTEEDLATLTQLYWFHPPKSNSIIDIKLCQTERKRQLETLRQWITLISNGEKTTDDKFARLEKVFENYVKSLSLQADEEDIEIFHGAGCATDDPELPHHVSTRQEIDSLLSALKHILTSTERHPALITMARWEKDFERNEQEMIDSFTFRSTEDGYCPKHQVDSIQFQVEALLIDLYGPIACKKHYLASSSFK